MDWTICRLNTPFEWGELGPQMIWLGRSFVLRRGLGGSLNPSQPHPHVGPQVGPTSGTRPLEHGRGALIYIYILYLLWFKAHTCTHKNTQRTKLYIAYPVLLEFRCHE
eukprot:TRINITY_DN34525_c0_g1_i2.p1 TRINITY_DN34525_c0_g1~~TRINITY_DN34525_c0_g1_i2.p1  ORF type:complete len:108 (-),score=0.47 TRINITY_DN34525_c0_g1_i2:109-432(-)